MFFETSYNLSGTFAECAKEVKDKNAAGYIYKGAQPVYFFRGIPPQFRNGNLDSTLLANVKAKGFEVIVVKTSPHANGEIYGAVTIRATKDYQHFREVEQAITAAIIDSGVILKSGNLNVQNPTTDSLCKPGAAPATGGGSPATGGAGFSLPDFSALLSSPVVLIAGVAALFFFMKGKR